MMRCFFICCFCCRVEPQQADGRQDLRGNVDRGELASLQVDQIAARRQQPG